MDRNRVYDLIDAERQRQERLKLAGRFDFTCADDELSDYEALAVLTEEVGEVARAILSSTGRSRDKKSDVQTELVQVCAVAVAWLEKFKA